MAHRAGKSGRQLDLGGYDLRFVLDLKLFPFTAIKATGANFLKQDLRGAELQSGVFDKADFRDCQMQGADLRGSSFKYARLARVNLEGARLCPLQFEQRGKDKRLQHVNMSGADLRYAHLSGADLRSCILMGADLSHAIIRGCDLRKADLSGAILRGATLIDCRMEDTVIDWAAL